MAQDFVSIRPQKNANEKPEVGLPPYERYGEEIPKEGTKCANCEYLADDKKHCTNKNFIKWNGPNKPAGSDKLPAPADRFCSIWWEHDEDK
jgi:hypothetical protein